MHAHPQPVGLHGPALRRNDALRVRCMDDEVRGHCSERHGEGVPEAIPQDHGQVRAAGLSELHQDLHRSFPAGDAGAGRPGDLEPPRQPAGRAHPPGPRLGRLALGC
eukprot:11183951-Lingulodinium_polyedra.AAC.1